MGSYEGAHTEGLHHAVIHCVSSNQQFQLLLFQIFLFQIYEMGKMFATMPLPAV